MSIRSLVNYITIGESTGTNSLKYLMLYFKPVIVAGKIKVSNLYKTF